MTAMHDAKLQDMEDEAVAQAEATRPPVRMTRGLRLLDLVRVTPEGVSFSNTTGIDGVDGPTATSVLISRQDWEDFGEPEQLTVGLRPGNQITREVWG